MASFRNRITTYSYDAAGNRTGQVDARNVAGHHIYDALDRLIATHYPATPPLDVAYTWDTPAAGCVTPNQLAKGRLSSVTDASGATAYCYNRYGDTMRKTQTI
ncbi:MAG: RHS repeat protein, partial [Proteobacteria bacterium]|nr:RHS repeat protein [Pseudomonadota bacterium]